MFLLLVFLVALLPVSTEGGEIFWGKEVKPHSRPYMALITYYDNRSETYLCGGFLVEKDIVMTAAHCNGRKMNVTLGAHNRNDLNNTQYIPVLKSVPHKDFSSETLVNDIMLLKLEYKAQLNHAVKTIALPKSQDWVKPGQVCTVAGWGNLANCSLSNTLQEVSLEVQNSRACKKLFLYYKNSIQLCVGNPKKKESIGKGDSGGPLVCDNVAQGIVSYQFCAGRTPRVFTRISTFLPWIQETMKLLQQP